MFGFVMNYLSSLRMRAPDHMTLMAAVRFAIMASLEMQAY
jgi:hypothetical protein